MSVKRSAVHGQFGELLVDGGELALQGLVQGGFQGLLIDIGGLGTRGCR